MKTNFDLKELLEIKLYFFQQIKKVSNLKKVSTKVTNKHSLYNNES